MRNFQFSMLMDGDNLVVLRNCIECNKVAAINATKEQMSEYFSGESFIQDIFPNVSSDDREQLFLSGLCGECWDRIFDVDA